MVAEGVETEAQLNALRGLGCDQYQGYFCSPALPAAQFERLIRQQVANDVPDAADLPEFQETWSKLTAIRKL